MIKNKTILILCKETTSFPMYFLGKEFEKNNNVHYFFTLHTEALNNNSFNKDTFFYFKKNIKKENIHDTRELNLKFLKNRKNLNIDYNRLREIEKKYTHFSGLNMQILSSQLTSGPFHGRYYYPNTTLEENLYWLILNYNKAESILEIIKPDYIFDIDIAEIQRTILNEIANYKKIPYVTPEHSRFKGIILPSFSLSKKIDDYFIQAYNKNRNNSKLNLRNFAIEVENYRSQSSIMPEIFKGGIGAEYEYSFSKAINYILIRIFNFFKNQIITFLSNEIKIPLNTPLYSNPYKKIFFLISTAIKRFYLFSKFNRYFEAPKKEENYIYMPLHYIPESTTYVKAPMYVNELNLIEAISKLLPINWRLYVKEHQSMLGERKIKFYKQVKKFSNVRLVKPNFYKDPKPWIEKSLGVVTIAGTTAFEASMLNKPAIVFGNVFYNVISGIKVAKSIEDLEHLFKFIEDNKWPKDNTMSCAAYLKTLREVGIQLNISSLINLSSKKIIFQSLNVKEKDELKNMIFSLKIFFEKAVNIYDKSKKY